MSKGTLFLKAMRPGSKLKDNFGHEYVVTAIEDQKNLVTLHQYDAGEYTHIMWAKENIEKWGEEGTLMFNDEKDYSKLLKIGVRIKDNENHKFHIIKNIDFEKDEIYLQPIYREKVVKTVRKFSLANTIKCLEQRRAQIVEKNDIKFDYIDEDYDKLLQVGAKFKNHQGCVCIITGIEDQEKEIQYEIHCKGFGIRQRKWIREFFKRYLYDNYYQLINEKEEEEMIWVLGSPPPSDINCRCVLEPNKKNEEPKEMITMALEQIELRRAFEMRLKRMGFKNGCDHTIFVSHHILEKAMIPSTAMRQELGAAFQATCVNKMAMIVKELADVKIRKILRTMREAPLCPDHDRMSLRCFYTLHVNSNLYTYDIFWQCDEGKERERFLKND